MANRECHGDFFSADGSRYYRCLQDGTAMSAPKEGEPCPHCGRAIEGVEAGNAEVTTHRIARLVGGGHVVLPD